MSVLKVIFLLSLFAVASRVTAIGATELQRRPNTTNKDIENQFHGAEEFDYEQGGDDWDDYYYCKYGKRQSPIDFPFFEEEILSPVPKDYFTKTPARFL